MKRTLVGVIAGLLLVGAFLEPVQAMNFYPPPSPCAPPPCTFVTRMVPCTRTEIVGEVVPYTQCVPVQKVGWRTQKVLLKGSPMGQPCGIDPCTKCCPPPFCEVVEQKVPFTYYENKTVQSYAVNYRPVCRPVMLPQTYMVQSFPLCQ